MDSFCAEGVAAKADGGPRILRGDSLKKAVGRLIYTLLQKGGI